MTEPSLGLNEDFHDMLACLLEAGARFLVVGAHAVSLHGIPRATGDLDLFIDPDAQNAEKVWGALLEFGAPVESLAVTIETLKSDDMVVQIGLPPRRIDLMTSVSGLDFETAWKERVAVRLGDLELPFIGKQALIRNKQAAGRLKDKADLEALTGEPTE